MQIASGGYAEGPGVALEYSASVVTARVGIVRVYVGDLAQRRVAVEGVYEYVYRPRCRGTVVLIQNLDGYGVLASHAWRARVFHFDLKFKF